MGAATAIVPGMQYVGGLVGAMGAQQAGAAQSAADRYNASLKTQNANAILDQANQDAAASARQSKALIGYGRALYGAAGVTGDGSVADVIGNGAALAELDRQTILYKGRMNALGYQEGATLDQFAATQAGIQANWQSASDILTGVSSATRTRALANPFS